MYNKTIIVLIITILSLNSCATSISYSNKYALVDGAYRQVSYQNYDFRASRPFVYIEDEKYFIDPSEKLYTRDDIIRIFASQEMREIRSRIPNSSIKSPNTGIEWIDKLYVMCYNLSYASQSLNVYDRYAVISGYDRYRDDAKGVQA